MNYENISSEQCLEVAKHNLKLAYLGKIGREREKFCLDYIEQKKRIYRETLARRRSELTQQDEQITCVKGCTYCCYEFATADIRACEAIAYFVSRDDELLEKFIKSYIEWRTRLAPHADLVAEICRLQDKVVRGDRAVVEALEKRIIEYFNLGIACPFLENNECVIYAVRPDVCFSQASTTPIEWCGFKTGDVPNVIQLLDRPIITPFYYGNDPEFNTIEIMAETVFQLLTDGYRYLDKISVLHGIYGEHIRDSVVRKQIKQTKPET